MTLIKSCKLPQQFHDLINKGVEAGLFPYIKNDYVCIRNYLIKQDDTVYTIYNKQGIVKEQVYSKASAIALAFYNFTGYIRCNNIRRLDRVIEKNHNDAVFFNYARNNATGDALQLADVRYQLAKSRVQQATHDLSTIITTCRQRQLSHTQRRTSSSHLIR